MTSASMMMAAILGTENPILASFAGSDVLAFGAALAVAVASAVAVHVVQRRQGPGTPAAPSTDLPLAA
jgi:hypothetical protein